MSKELYYLEEIRVNFRLLLLNILLLSTFIFAQDRKVYVDSLFSWDGDGNTLSDYNYGIQTKDIADSSVTSAKIAGFKVADTTALKALTGKADGDVVYMEEISSGAGVGSGDFVYKSSGYTADKGVVLSASGGGYFIRKDWIDDKTIVNPEWWGARGDNSTDDYSALQSAINFAIANDSKVVLPGGIYKYTQELTATLAFHQGFTMEALGGGRSPAAITQLAPSGCNGLRITSNTNNNGIELRNLVIERDTTVTSRADTALILTYAENVLVERPMIRGFKVAIYCDLVGQMNIDQPIIRFNTFGLRQVGHSDGISIRGGFIAQNDSVGVYLYFSGGSVIYSTEISHQPIAVEIENNTTLTIIGGRYESADSCTWLINQSCNLTAINPSLLPGTVGIIARMPSTTANSSLQLINPRFAGSYAAFDSTIIITTGDNSYVSLQEHFKNTAVSSYIKVYDQAKSTIFIPGPFKPIVASSSAPANSKTVGQLWQGHVRSGFANDSYLSFIQQTDTDTYWANRLTDNNDVKYGLNTDSTSAARIDGARTLKLRRDLTLAAAGNFTRDTLYSDIFVNNTDYEIQVTPMWATDSLLTAKIISRNYSTGQIISSVYHKGINGTSGKLYYTITYKAVSTDY